jgi:hypothetical protein
MTIRPTPFLRTVMLADAAASGATGLLAALGADLLAPLTGLPAGLLAYAGLSLLPYAALVAWLALRERLPRAAVWAVIAYNGLWALDSLVVAFGGFFAPTALGIAFVVAQAAVVAAFAELQLVGLKRAPAAA